MPSPPTYKQYAISVHLKGSFNIIVCEIHAIVERINL